MRTEAQCNKILEKLAAKIEEVSNACESAGEATHQQQAELCFHIGIMIGLTLAIGADDEVASVLRMFKLQAMAAKIDLGLGDAA